MSIFYTFSHAIASMLHCFYLFITYLIILHILLILFTLLFIFIIINIFLFFLFICIHIISTVQLMKDQLVGDTGQKRRQTHATESLNGRSGFIAP